MLSEVWLLVGGFLVFIGLLASDGLLMVVGSLAVFVWLSARLWDKYSFRAVTHSRSVGRNRAFIGDEIDYAVTLNNDKLLPLIWVDIQDSFPEGLELHGAVMRTSVLETHRQHSIVTSLLPYQRATWKYTLHCQQRGYHRIGPARLRSGDIFGFTAGEDRHTAVDHVLVYPKVIDLDHLLFLPEHPFGEVRGRRPLYQDTARAIGQRDYQSGDPLNHINWKATARASRLQTKVFEPVVSLNMLIAMSGSTGDHIWQGSNRRLFERTVTAAASAASLAERRGYSYGLISNAVASYSGKWLSVPIGGSSAQLPLILEALAMAAPYVVASLPEVFRAERGTLPAGATLLLVIGAITDSIQEQIFEMQANGYQVTVLYAGDGSTSGRIAGVPVISMTQELDADFANTYPRDTVDDGEHEPVLA